MTSHLTQNQSPTPHNCLEGAPFTLAPAVFVHSSSPLLSSLCPSHTGPFDVPQILLAMPGLKTSPPVLSPRLENSSHGYLCTTCSLGSFRSFSKSPHQWGPSQPPHLQGEPPLLPHAFSLLLPVSFLSVILITIWHSVEFTYLFTFHFSLLECKLH